MVTNAGATPSRQHTRPSASRVAIDDVSFHAGCYTNGTELYDTKAGPWRLNNLLGQ